MKLGNYLINVTEKLPQKVQSGFDKVFSNMVGANYTPIAYLGSKVVNGTNHAILAEQNLVTGKDIKAICLVILNEKPGDLHGETFSVVDIQSLLSDGGLKLGAININPTNEIPADAKEVFDKHFGGFLGAKNKAFALLATQIVHGVAYVFAVESQMLVKPLNGGNIALASDDYSSIKLVKVYSDFSEIETLDVISGYNKSDSLGYAFTWLTNERASKDNLTLNNGDVMWP